MLQLRRELYLAPESLNVDRCGEVGRQNLNHDFPAERSLFSEEDP